MDNDTAEKIICGIAAKAQNLTAPGVRQDIISQARLLIKTLETPMETLLQTIWEEPTRYTSLRLAIDLRIFETLAADSGFKTDSELCIPSGADPTFVSRITRHLAATGIIHEIKSGVYSSTPFSKALAQPAYYGGVKFCFDAVLPVFASTPSYFAKNRFVNPSDTMDGPFQHVHGPGHAFSWMNKQPGIWEAFLPYVYAQRTERPAWTDEGFYPVSRLIEGLVLEGDQSALIDVGGGAGLCLEEFRVQVPQWKGRLILQEQEDVIKHTTGLNKKIELMIHDFFTPQPIKGARAYYLRSIMHDWPDAQCREILNQLKSAMEPGYSKILLNDNVIPDQNAAWQHTALDMYMMALNAGQERTESHWRELIASVGLEIAGIWNKGEGNESLIELVMK